MYALVDCNNFYCSCERVFQPHLEGKPVVVLSNNDGCAIARSEEAKAIGIVMGTPEFMIRDELKKHNVKIFSSNYTLYQDMSNRVMKILASFVPRLELYSIDEAFLDMHDLLQVDLLKLGMNIRKTIKQNVGIPVTIGIARTKALAKMANRYAKKKHKDVGVFWAANKKLEKEMLEFTDVEDIWGIGHQYAQKLKALNINKAADLVNVPEEWMRSQMTVVGQRLWNDLNGTASIQWEFEPPPKKNICTSRSFGKLLNDKNEIKEALVNYAAMCAQKLRAQQTCAKVVYVFLQTNKHRQQDHQYKAGIKIKLPVASNDTGVIIKHAVKGLNIIFMHDRNYQKCGVIVHDLVPEGNIQLGLFQTENDNRKKIIKVVDKANKTFGRDIVRIASQGYERRYKLRADYLSQRYTTRLEELPELKH